MKYLLIAILLLGAVSAQYFSQEEVKDSPMMTEDQPEDAYVRLTHVTTNV